MRAAMMVLGLGALSLGGCISVAAVNPDGGIVENANSAKAALKRAEAHCAATGRTAKAVKYDALMGALTFECIAR